MVPHVVLCLTCSTKTASALLTVQVVGRRWPGEDGRAGLLAAGEIIPFVADEKVTRRRPRSGR